MRLLGVSNFTLWKWNVIGFLKPLTVDGQTAAYFLPNVEKIKASGYSVKPGRKKKEAAV